MNPQQFAFNIPAGSVQGVQTPGKVLTVKSCTLPINVQFDGGAYTQIQAGAVQDLRPTGFGSIIFQNPASNAAAVTIVFWIADAPVAFSAQDNSNLVAPTYAIGNLGIANNTAATASLPACTSGVGGLLQILSTKAYVIPATDPVLGHGRQMITISVDKTSTSALTVSDTNGCTIITLQASAQIQLVTSAAIQIQGTTNTALVSIGQFYSTTN